MRKAGIWIVAAAAFGACLLAFGFFLGRTATPYSVSVHPYQLTETVQTEAVTKRPELDRNSKVNINTADEAQLQILDGIGPELAKRITEYREENGGFLSVEELKNVKGIGEKSFEKLKDFVTVED